MLIGAVQVPSGQGTFLEVDHYNRLVSGVAPVTSPGHSDWFVGIDSVSLCDGSSWKQTVTADLYLYDAGEKCVHDH